MLHPIYLMETSLYMSQWVKWPLKCETISETGIETIRYKM